MKLNDRGPVFFRQVRVGRNGQLFRCLKFRTMVVDAEAKLAELQRTNERTGPLFKMDRDPRVTRVGQFLRDTSLDELPQLFNVLTGRHEPRRPPAGAARRGRPLRRGAARAAPAVRPGITGLWQVEARDNPSFSAYRRLDLFYVDNWSVTLDIVIMLATVEQVIARAVTMVFKRTPKVEPACLERPEEPKTAARLTPPRHGAPSGGRAGAGRRPRSPTPPRRPGRAGATRWRPGARRAHPLTIRPGSPRPGRPRTRLADRQAGDEAGGVVEQVDEPAVTRYSPGSSCRRPIAAEQGQPVAAVEG